jgi:hypothetical protein
MIKFDIDHHDEVLTELLSIRRKNTETTKPTQVKKYGPDPAGKHRKSMECGSSIPGNRSGDRIYPVPPGTGRNLAKPAARYGHRIPTSKS